jgi:hypothetical protein
MCRDPSKLSDETRSCCDDVIQGIVAVSNGDNVKKNDIRTASAKALVSVLTTTPGYPRIRAVVVSSIGSGGSKIKVGFGIGSLIRFHLRHILHDHDGQEAGFLSSMKERTYIVCPTGLTEGGGDWRGCPVWGQGEMPQSRNRPRSFGQLDREGGNFQ